MSYSAESYLDVINYNIRKHILNQPVKLEDDRDANLLLKNQFLHPDELQEEIINLLGVENIKELLKNPEKIIYNELEFFKSNDVSGNTPSFFDSINRCASKTSKVNLQSLLSQTITKVSVLEERQFILQYFANYLSIDESNYLQSVIDTFKKDEDPLYWNITPKKPEMEEIFNILFFTQPWSKFLNSKQEFVNIFYYFLIIFTPFWGIFGPIFILLIPFFITNFILKIPIPISFYMNQLKNILFGNQFFAFLKLAKKGYNVYMAGGGSNKEANWESNMKDKVVNFILDTITGKLGQLVYFIVFIGGYLWNIYNTFVSSSNFNKLINFLHGRINCIQTMLKNVKTILASDLLKKGDGLSILKTSQFDVVSRQCQILLKDDDYIKFILNTNTFSQSPNLISHKGNIIKGYYLLDKNIDSIKPFIRFLALLDTWFSSSKLQKEGFNPVSFKKDNKPILKLEECFSPVLGKESVCNNCILGCKDDNSSHLDKEEEDNISKGQDTEVENKVEGFIDSIEENKSNCLLTGPNGSGKSSYLKTVMSSIICSQTLGLAPVKSGEITPFYHLSTYLNIPDCQGKESLFQAEMNRCYQHLKKCEKLEEEGLPSFHIMDEIFVSTNFLEGLSGAYAVVNYLQKFNHSMHIITTHFDKLVEKPFDKYQLKHFTIDEIEDETTGEKQLMKDYKLRDGKNEKHLALHLLKCKGFNEELLTDAKKMYQELTLPTPDRKDDKDKIDNTKQTKEISTQTELKNIPKKIVKNIPKKIVKNVANKEKVNKEKINKEKTNTGRGSKTK